ncbi:DUF302 domain-containing protein [Sphaerisporangium sp. NPDC005289]|uniref:DUF302 domain-containing protein n=1 Tax=Sphaerisporangium sp. NPDC005289 TaxID=3155247 RepID=UPI0033B4689F
MTAKTSHVTDVAREAHRLIVDVGMPFEEFRLRYERAVPPFDAPVYERLVAEGAGWPAVRAAADRNASHGFVIFWSLDNGALLRGSGEWWRSVQYLMGNAAIAEGMFRHDPAVMLYAPLRTTIYEYPAGVTHFAIEQPSAQFAQFGHPEITAVGAELDEKLARLLRHLRVPVPDRLLHDARP